jgi:hypothetical protein
VAVAVTEDRLEKVRGLKELWDASPESASIERYDLAPPLFRRQPKIATFPIWSSATALGWALIFGALLVFQPEPANPQAAIPLWADLLFAAFFMALFATFAGLAYRARWGLGASIGAAGLGVLVALACSVTGHHPGAWWAYELGGFAFLGGLSLVAFRKVKQPS